MRELVRTGRYVMTIHALDAMEDDELTVFDVERCFLTGRIVERQRDRARREWKYLVEGWLTDGSRGETGGQHIWCATSVVSGHADSAGDAKLRQRQGYIPNRSGSRRELTEVW